MPLTNEQAVIALLIMGGVTFLTRALPFFLFGGEKRPSRAMLYLGKYLPPAVIAMLVVYSFRHALPGTGSQPFWPALIGLIAVTALHLWKRNDFLSIFGGTAIYMFFLQVVFS